MLGIENFFVFLTTGILLNLYPGPDSLYIIGRSDEVIYQDWGIPPMTQSIEGIRKEFADQIFYKAAFENKIVGGIE